MTRSSLVLAGLALPFFAGCGSALTERSAKAPLPAAAEDACFGGTPSP